MIIVWEGTTYVDFYVVSGVLASLHPAIRHLEHIVRSIAAPFRTEVAVVGGRLEHTLSHFA